MTGVVWSFSLRRSVSNKPQSLPFPEHCQSRALAVPWRPRQPHDQGGKPDGLFTVIFSLLPGELQELKLVAARTAR